MLRTSAIRKDCWQSCKLLTKDRMIPCLGYCGNSYHIWCIGLNSAQPNPQNWTCQPCKEKGANRNRPQTTSNEITPAISRSTPILQSVPSNVTTNRNISHSLEAHTREMTNVSSSPISQSVANLISSVENSENNAPSENQRSPNSTKSASATIENRNTGIRTAQNRITEADKARYAQEWEVRQQQRLQDERRAAARQAGRSATTNDTDDNTDNDTTDETSGTSQTTSRGQSGSSSRRTEPISQLSGQQECRNQSAPNVEDETDYEIESIVGHRIRNDGTLEYRTRWVGYSQKEDSWLKESEFVYAYKTLCQYKTNKSLGAPTIPLPSDFGATAAKRWNPSIWQNADRIINTVQGYLRKDLRNLLQIKVFKAGDQLGNCDKIYLIAHEHHVLVGLYKKNRNLMTLADGGNSYIEDEEIRESLNSWIKVTIRAVRFPHQSKVDHCASSAAAICIKFTQNYANGTPIADPLIIPKTPLDEIRKWMHKGPSESMTNWTPVNKIIKTRCQFPGCSYVTTKRDQRVMAAHSRTHQMK